eukprot:CAMPEP_0168334026 /NCGR_PEP_ID=MMETSP0213-20121227/9987_1 /TAXON_ID=151035 /ORGANISM="Euplotes harpa, Strain FSP1.4" /LENGTH=134 /DNA_ID=CAMNT_0008338521 /DNA_START=144 /DNA_END=548 /DNA_ORIENTATION=+
MVLLIPLLFKLLQSFVEVLGSVQRDEELRSEQFLAAFSLNLDSVSSDGSVGRVVILDQGLCSLHCNGYGASNRVHLNNWFLFSNFEELLCLVNEEGEVSVRGDVDDSRSHSLLLSDFSLEFGCVLAFFFFHIAG